MTDWVSIPVTDFEELAAWKQRCLDAEEEVEFEHGRAERAEAHVAKMPALVEAMSTILSRVEDANREFVQLDIGSIARAALAAWEQG